MSKKKNLPGRIASQFVKPGDEIDYGADAGAGFPEKRPITESEACELREDAAQILAAEHLLTKERNKRNRNERNKDIKAAKARFAHTLFVEHGLRTYTWPDGLSVRIDDPHLPSGRDWDSSTPMQVIFNR